MADRWLLAALVLATLGCGRTRLLSHSPSGLDPDTFADGGIAGGGSGTGGSQAGAGAGAGAGGSIPPPPPGCGNGIVDPGEQCDGRAELTCADVGFGSGALFCDPEICLYDVTGCSGVPACALATDTDLPRACLAAMCACDPMTFSICDDACFRHIECALDACGASGLDGPCQLRACPGTGSESERFALQLESGCLWGHPLCELNTMPPPPPGCGDGQLNDFEECDGDQLRGTTCQSFGFAGGFLGCDPISCFFLVDGCFDFAPTCGNGVVEGMEACDGADFGGRTCNALGLGNGELGCTPRCELDTSACRLCGDGRVQEGELCDGTRLQGQSCVSLGYSGGALGCTRRCDFDTDDCALCGDGNVGAGENCDGADLGGASCESLGLGSGTLGCSTSSCHFDTRACVDGPSCGNGVAEADEQCDSSDLASHDCQSLGFGTGMLGCNGATCRYDTSACVRDSGRECVRLCAESSCATILNACEELMGCNEIRECLDGCHDDPAAGCALGCATGNISAAAVAVVAADCVGDCALECR